MYVKIPALPDYRCRFLDAPHSMKAASCHLSVCLLTCCFVW